MYKQSNYTKCVSEILEQKLTINKRVFGGKTWNGFVIVKSLGKYEQRYFYIALIEISAIIVAKATY